ncbi:hypothetical protein [Clostridium tarantellae]|uniref:Uncharacterized protein n=1 Tax=Clostridium tarantellae TaxID=39493 RepID=A0A6I1MLF5_9CLOT|nr:hypothetical protein [Clostridium tarantellae]MPQ44346.1 hypothetical protein [Clostridium tarantellae]
MQSLNYCLECQRVFLTQENCEFCGSINTKLLKKRTSVNVIGTKVKGQILNCKEGIVSIIINNESNEKMIKDYEIKNLKKIL